jgi:hypothetical protein
MPVALPPAISALTNFVPVTIINLVGRSCVAALINSRLGRPFTNIPTAKRKYEHKKSVLEWAATQRPPYLTHELGSSLRGSVFFAPFAPFA